jgi:folate-binding protein YgfZ
MNDTIASERLEHSRIASDLDHLALLVVQGPDARVFLDSQLTRNVPPAGMPSTVAPFGYCSPKGRLLANGLLWADGDVVSLLLSRDIAEAIAKRLRMYVLRAKVKIDDVTASRRIAGVVDPVAAPPEVVALAPWTALKIDDRTWVRFPDADARRRWLCIAGDDHAIDDRVDASTWRWLDIRSGLPRIVVATQDRFVPQMLNLEALGGVDFKKGCYPGQEVVARSQYLGKLKRRMTLASLDASADVPAPATDVWAADDHEPCGMIVAAERGPDGRVALLAELPLARFASTDLCVGTIDGPLLTIDPLPYALPDNEVFVRPKL